MTLQGSKGGGARSCSERIAGRLASLVAAMLKHSDRFNHQFRHSSRRGIPDGVGDAASDDEDDHIESDSQKAYDEAIAFFQSVSDETMAQALRRLYRKGELEARRRAARVADVTVTKPR